MAEVFSFESLAGSDLIVDAIYEGGSTRSTGDDALSRLIPGAGNQGGFRQVGRRDAPRLVVLYSSMDDADWPDAIDIYSGIFTYFGDNKKPGLGLHETHRGGNRLLQICFARRSDSNQREQVPPFLVFTRGPKGRDVVFRGLAAPGLEGDSGEDLVAVWRTKDGHRFQNYRARFTILDVAVVSREWISLLRQGESSRSCEPNVWREWIESGVYKPLKSLPTIEYRTREQQTPAAGRDESLVRCVYDYFKETPHDFEHCAARLVRMMDEGFVVSEVTRPSADGGRDAIGAYRLGPVSDPIALEFALEAKCYSPSNGVGVKELSRLISRLRHREFGVLITTSYLARQAYDELRHDRHPVIVIAGSDIAAILLKAGMGSRAAVQRWLESSFPRS